jgi:hypothetical protein
VIDPDDVHGYDITIELNRRVMRIAATALNVVPAYEQAKFRVSSSQASLQLAESAIEHAG